jgi:hypothetical protein
MRSTHAHLRTSSWLPGQQACTHCMGCPVQRQRLQANSCSRITVRKRRLRLRSAARSHFPAPPRRLKFPTEVCTGVARTKEQSQRRVRSLVPKMVFNDRPTLKDGPARISSWPVHPKVVYICADLSSRPNFSLAVLRRTIHFRDLQEISRLSLPLPAIHYACHPLVVTRSLYMVDHGNSDNCTRRFQLDSQLILHCFQHGWTR